MIITPQMQVALDSGHFRFEWLLWIEAKNRSTGASEAAGIHTGLDTLPITIDGGTREYQGAGHLMEMPEFIYKEGLVSENFEISLAILSPEITNMIRAYDSDLAPADVHLAIFDKDENFMGASTVMRGFVDGIVINGSPEDMRCDIKLTSNVKESIRGLTIKKSHQSQKMMYPNDEGFKYAAVAGTNDTLWGTGHGRQYASLRYSNAMNSNLNRLFR